jgi:hypothetical protein
MCAGAVACGSFNILGGKRDVVDSWSIASRPLVPGVPEVHGNACSFCAVAKAAVAKAAVFSTAAAGANARTIAVFPKAALATCRRRSASSNWTRLMI